LADYNYNQAGGEVSMGNRARNESRSAHAGKYTPGLALIDAVFIVLSFLCVSPFVMIVSASLSSNELLTKVGYSLLPRGFSLQAYEFVFKSPRSLLMAYAITITVTCIGTSVGVVVTAMLGYVIARRDFPLSRPFALMLLFTLLFNGGMVPTYIMVSRYYHMKDTIFALIVPGLLAPWNVFLMRGFFNDIEYNLIDAAKIDGASELRTFFSIVTPVSKPAYATVALFIAFGYWNDWFSSLMYIENQNLTSLQYYLMRILNNVTFIKSALARGMPANITLNLSDLPSETLRMAMCVLAAGPMLVVFPFFQKYFVRGLTVGAVKG